MVERGRREHGVLLCVLRADLVQVHPEDVLDAVVAQRVERQLDVGGERRRHVVVAVDDHDDRAERRPPAVDHVERRRDVAAVELAALHVQPPADTGVELHVEVLLERGLGRRVAPRDCGQDRVGDDRDVRSRARGAGRQHREGKESSERGEAAE